MPAYQPRFSRGDELHWQGRYCVVMDVRREGRDVEYQLSQNGRKQWTDAALVDRDASAYDPAEVGAP